MQDLEIAEIELSDDEAPVTLSVEHDGDPYEVPFGLDDSPFMTDEDVRKIIRKQQREREAGREITASKLHKQFDLLEAQFPENHTLLVQRANSPLGIKAHVISQSKLDRTEERPVKVVRPKARVIGGRTHHDSLTVELTSISDEWKYMDGTVSGIKRRVFDGQTLWILTE